MNQPLALGLDFGTESVRALLVDLEGQERGVAVAPFAHGQITERLPTTGEQLPPQFALQHPDDWIDSAGVAVRAALAEAQAVPEAIVGLGVDFTSCTLLPTRGDGTPLCRTEAWHREKYAWPKLWKHHGAQAQAEHLTTVARNRQESWLARYGGTVGLEWFFPKILETLEAVPAIHDATAAWVEAGDWFVWQLVGGGANEVARSACQAGYKALWSRDAGFPSVEFFRAVHPLLAEVVETKLRGRFLAPGQRAGDLTAKMAGQLGLSAGIPVSAAIIDAHAGVPGAGAAEAGTLVMVMGTSSCHMLNSRTGPLIPGIAGVVKDGILPGYFGYETGQAAVGDAFDWVRRLAGAADYASLTQAAAAVGAGAAGVRCVDWFNGCRTPLMNGALAGRLTGLKLHHGPEHIFQAVMEASACGLRWIVALLRSGGVPVERLVATGGLPHHNPHFVAICANVLGQEIIVPEARQGPALGAAILGALAGGAFPDAAAAIAAMANHRNAKVIAPDPSTTEIYQRVYEDYRRLAQEAASP